jgi:dTDP-4-dehydrorhamnose 3,5-epimerase-like enzyme
LDLIPSELIKYFTLENFENYPLVQIPQQFSDHRGEIINIADGALGDVAVIHSNQNSVRANHYHKNDWHLTYVVSGSVIYSWKKKISDNWEELRISKDQLFYTPPTVIHKMFFEEKTTIIAVSAMSRLSESYEADTIRI